MKGTKMITIGTYQPAAPGARTIHEVRPLRDRQGQRVIAGVSEAGQLTVWHGTQIRWQGRVPQQLQTPADLFRWLQAANS